MCVSCVSSISLSVRRCVSLSNFEPIDGLSQNVVLTLMPCFVFVRSRVQFLLPRQLSWLRCSRFSSVPPAKRRKVSHVTQEPFFSTFQLIIRWSPNVRLLTAPLDKRYTNVVSWGCVHISVTVTLTFQNFATAILNPKAILRFQGLLSWVCLQA
jgi:hypothetical protein